MRKKVVIGLCVCGLLLAGLGGAWGYLYYHPRQYVGSWDGGNVRYPVVTFQPYNGLGIRTPAALAEQSAAFNDGVGAFAHEMVAAYQDDLTLDYTLERGDQGTDVLFTGRGTAADGTVEDISQRLHFDLVIRGDAKWH